MSGDKIIAMGLLTQNDLIRLGDTFKRAWPVDKVPSFDELLRAIDEADDTRNDCCEHRQNQF